MLKHISVLTCLLLIACATTAEASPFDATDPAASLVVYQPADAEPWFNWKRAQPLRHHIATPEARTRDAIVYLREGIERIAGKKLPVEVGSSLDRGIVFALRSELPSPLADDPRIDAALRNNGSNDYNHIEAYYLRSESNRLLIIANTAKGFPPAVATLLEQVGYEVLGMGPNWIHTPKHQGDLTFDVDIADRPSFLIRALTGTSGQVYGVGTISDRRDLIQHPGDEPVEKSYQRWKIGSRTLTASMAQFPGHAFQAYHRDLVAYMREHQTNKGFICATKLGLDADRPTEVTGDIKLWINTDPAGSEAHGKAYVVRSGKWQDGNLAILPVAMDITLPYVRELILERLKDRALKWFEKNPDKLLIFGMDPEDGGGYSDFAALASHPQWYPEYRKTIGDPLDAPYVLHGQFGFNQPRESWDPTLQADHVYAVNNWLLREFDTWIDTLPQDQRQTATGHDIKRRIRCSLYCYNYHDVPPSFNLDPRIRLMIAGYPKHRGRGKFKQIARQHDAARAFQIMLPREPSGEYRIISLSSYWDNHIAGIAPRFEAHPDAIHDDMAGTYEVGIRALNYEIDFNFGKMGLGYYLLAKQLWNVDLTPAQLDALRDRWLQRAYGSGWEAMKQYHDFMLPRNYPINGPHAWSRAIRFIELADTRVDPANEPDAQQRIDDIKQFWLFYYLVDTDQTKTNNPIFRTFAWKGQMSYMTAMHMITRKFFKTNDVATIVDEAMLQTSPRYTHDETQQWWNQILDHWPLRQVNDFGDAILADGSRGSSVDQNDLVRIETFAEPIVAQQYIYNSALSQPVSFITHAAAAGDTIGFHLLWPDNPDPKQHMYHAKEVPWGAELWNPAARRWEPIADVIMTTQASKKVSDAWTKRDYHVVTVQMPAAQAGAYRFEVGKGGLSSYLAPLDFDITIGRATGRHTMTFTDTLTGHTQSARYFYIPKGTKRIDMEVWDSHNNKRLTLYKGLPPTRATPSRIVDVGALETHRVELEPGEDGTIAKLEGNGFAFPYLYSVPLIWSKSPSMLMVPRAIAEADQLPILDSP